MGAHFLKLLALLLQLLQSPESRILLLQVREDMTVKTGERWGGGGQWKSPGRAGGRTNFVEGVTRGLGHTEPVGWTPAAAQ